MSGNAVALGVRGEREQSRLYDTLSYWRECIAYETFRVAAYLTDPVCNAHECFFRLKVSDELHKGDPALLNIARKAAVVFEMIFWGALSIVATIPGIALRALAASIQTEPYLYVEGNGEPKELPENKTFTLLSWNICCVSAGYSITDAGVRHWSHRIDKVIDEIVRQDADVNVLFEIFDTKSGYYITDKLKNRGYNYFYFNIGPRAVGVSSGTMVASKYKIKNPEFVPFPKEMLDGRTKNAEKGIFSFDLIDSATQNSFAKINATHLQHGEMPEHSTPDEIRCRKEEMEMVIDKVNQVRSGCVVLTGDLNLGDGEYRRLGLDRLFTKNCHYPEGESTWPGDEYCAKLVGKEVSGPLNLDHTIVKRGTARSILTTLIPTGFDPKIFQDGPLSDHGGLKSVVVLNA